MTKNTLKVIGLIGGLALAPTTFASGMGGMGMGGMGFGGFGMSGFSNVVMTSNGLMAVNTVRGFEGDDFRGVVTSIAPTTLVTSGFGSREGDDVRLVTTIPAASVTSVPATVTAVPVSARFRSEGFESRSFGSFGFARGFDRD